MTILLIAGGLLVALPLGVWAFIRFNPQFGGRLTTEHKARYGHSPQWNGKAFVNQTETVMDMGPAKIPEMLRQQRQGRAKRRPTAPLPLLPFDAEAWATGTVPKFVWFGHSAGLLRLQGLNLLIDPMLGPNAAPISPIATKRFSKNTLEIIDALPPIDVLLLTHDHYDHLDYASIKRLKNKVQHYCVALGAGRHLERWGIPQEHITELDWWQNHSIDAPGDMGSIEITFTPTRHFAGRGITDRNKSLWGGWVFKTEDHCLYWSGDGGYGAHFKEIGERLGPFNWAFMECGQYNAMWHAIHMYPEESAQAAKDVGAGVAVPVHWGGFSLAMHPWQEPVERFMAQAGQLNQTVCLPRLGQVVALGQEPAPEAWWNATETP